MSGRSGRGEEDLPVFDAVEPADTGAVRSAGRRGGGQARGAGIAAALLVILVAGIAVGNLEKEGKARSSGSPRATSIHVVAGPIGTASPCGAQPPDDYPSLTMSVTGVPYAVEAWLGIGYHSGQEVKISPAWLVPSLAHALYMEPRDTFDISTKVHACIRSLALSYRPTTSLTPGPGGDGLFEEDFQPSVETVTLEGIPVGDWVLRAEAHFEMLGDDPGAEIVTTSYFRVVAGVTPTVTDAPEATPEVTPATTPAVACGSREPGPDLAVRLVGGIGDPVPGAPEDIGAVTDGPPAIPPDVPEVPIGLGNPVQVVTDDATCAVSWDIELIDIGTGSLGRADVLRNPNRDPAFAAQNRWQIAIDGEQILVARLEFANGLSIIRSWRVTPQPFQLPAAFVISGDGRRFPASPGCGLTVELSNGYSSGDSCASTGYRPDSEALQVPAYQPVTFVIPGWNIQSWAATCGTIVSDGGTDAFSATDGCDLGGASSEDGGPLQPPVAFLLRPGDAVVRLDVGAIASDGDRFSVTFFAHVVAR